MREAGNVVATVTGHAHQNGYVLDEVRHRTWRQP